MPRFTRLWMPDSVQHLIGRFVNRAYRMRGPLERTEYLRRLGATAAETDWKILAYAVMSNHVHVCAVAGQMPSRRLMQPLHGGFARWLNRRDKTLGPVFAARFSAIVCPSPHVARLIAYIHNNPVRAGLVSNPADSAWTSHRAYLGHETPPPWLDVQRGLALCGVAGAGARIDFDALVQTYAQDPRDANLSGTSAARTRRLLRVACGGPVEASDPIVTDGGSQHEVRAAPGTPLRPRWPGEPTQVLERVEAETGIARAQLQSRERTYAVCQARRIALLAWQQLGRPQAEMSVLLGLSAGAASHLLHRNPARRRKASEEVLRIVEACWALPNRD